jgi:hypothetical protein
MDETPRIRHKLGLFALAAAAMLSNACMVNSAPDDSYADGSAGSGGAAPAPVPTGTGPVAHNAHQAFPDKPASLPVLSASEIAKACAIEAPCYFASDTKLSERLSDVDLCAEMVSWTAERAIPLTGLLSGDERMEFFVNCLLALPNPNQCSAVDQCGAPPAEAEDDPIDCQEDGCEPDGIVDVTCHGSIATVRLDDGTTVKRDCSKADAECDPTSSTGCTDRHFTRCPSGESRDYCDGNVRLGCDGENQVSYHDCTRMGGTCGVTGGDVECIYNDGEVDARCKNYQGASCDGALLEACVNDQFVTVPAPELCGASVPVH